MRIYQKNNPPHAVIILAHFRFITFILLFFLIIFILAYKSHLLGKTF